MGVTIAVRYLMERAMATSASAWEVPEWPPHPDRLFMALVACHFEGEELEEGRAALEWLETQSAPTVYCSPAGVRDVVTHYVPVNDVSTPRVKDMSKVKGSAIEAAIEVLPEARPKQPRSFPTAVPDHDTVYFQWELEPEDFIKRALKMLISRLTRLGHSSTLVWAWLVNELAVSQLIRLAPTSGSASLKLRVPHRGRLRSLEDRFQRGLRPTLAPSHGYGVAQEREAPEVHQSLFEPSTLILAPRRESGKRLARLGLRDTLAMTGTLRDALLSKCPEPIPESLSGHLPDGSPSQDCHLAIFPLAYVGRPHADGHLLGFGLALPRAGHGQQTELAEVLQRVLEGDLALYRGRYGEWTLELKPREWAAEALRPQTWSGNWGGARRWATVTPIVLDRHLKTRLPRRDDRVALAEALERRECEIAHLVAAACVRQGLPSPGSVVVSATPFLEGVPTVQDFPKLSRRGMCRHHTHALVTFNEPVRGPVLLGSGRYRGYGLCRPFSEPKKEAETDE